MRRHGGRLLRVSCRGAGDFLRCVDGNVRFSGFRPARRDRSGTPGTLDGAESAVAFPVCNDRDDTITSSRAAVVLSCSNPGPSDIAVRDASMSSGPTAA